MNTVSSRKFVSSLMLAILALIGMGLVQVYSSSFILATESFGDGLFFFERQLIFAVCGIALMFAISFIPFQLFRKWGWLLWIVAMLGVLMTLVPGLGVRVGGAIRWIQMPFGLRFEPSELLKFSFCLVFAALMTRSENWLSKLHPLVIIGMIIGPLLLLLKQPDFGSFAIICTVFLSLLFTFGLRLRWIVAGLAVMVPAFWVLVMNVPYRRNRVLAFLDPWSDSQEKGFQVIQSMLSFHSGGVTGVGMGQGQGKLFFLPEAHTDFTLAVFGEELGFIGFLLLLALYGFVLLRGFQIAIKAEDRFAKTFSLGLTITFGLSVFINMGVVLGLLPTKGLTLPFLSYGGSSLLVLCLMFGILFSLERELKGPNDRVFSFKNRSWK